MVKKLILAILTTYSTLATAGPDQIDIIGLIPGTTTTQELSALGKVAPGGKVVFLEIGGYKMPCGGEFKGGMVQSLLCLTGGNRTQASNFEIHETLVKGFTAKFGLPDKNYTEPVRNRLGVEYKSNEVWWIDKQGNGLILYSIQGKVDEGALFINSAEKMQKIIQDAAQTEQSRKF